MIRVRYPNGTVLEYNGAYWFVRETEGYWLWDSSDKKRFVAVIPFSSGAAIEYVSPCRVIDGFLDAVSRLAADPDRLRDLPHRTLSALKKVLRKFHMQRGWTR